MQNFAIGVRNPVWVVNKSKQHKVNLIVQSPKWKHIEIKRKSQAKVNTSWIWRTICVYSFSNIHLSNAIIAETILRAKTIS